MSVVKFIESFLFRDLLSYLVPGVLNLLIIFYYLEANCQSWVQTNISELPLTLQLFLIFTFAYSLGYIGSSFMFLIRKLIPILDRPKISPPPEGIKKVIINFFGDWFPNNTDLNDKELTDASSLCSIHVQKNAPDLYFEKIDRRVTLRNFEVGLSFTSLFCSLLILLYESGCKRVLFLFPLMIFIFLLVISKKNDKEIDELPFLLFYIFQKKTSGDNK